jgi:hypothetical protein
LPLVAAWVSVSAWASALGSALESVARYESALGWGYLNCRHTRSVRLMLPKRLKKHAESFFPQIFPSDLDFQKKTLSDWRMLERICND